MRSLGYKISHCLSANHNPELRCVICTGVTLFALVLHLNCTAVSQSESSNFFMCIINIVITISDLLLYMVPPYSFTDYPYGFSKGAFVWDIPE